MPLVFCVSAQFNFSCYFFSPLSFIVLFALCFIFRFRTVLKIDSNIQSSVLSLQIFLRCFSYIAVLFLLFSFCCCCFLIWNESILESSVDNHCTYYVNKYAFGFLLFVYFATFSAITLRLPFLFYFLLFCFCLLLDSCVGMSKQRKQHKLNGTDGLE